MKKMIATAAEMVFAFAVCPNDDNTTVEEEKEKEVPDASDEELQAVVDYFEGEGFNIGERAFKAYEMVGAVDGFGVDVNGEEIEFYLYEEGSEKLEELRSEGQFAWMVSRSPVKSMATSL